jgi:uncharacterized protein (TIGR02996 family)
MKKSPAEQAFLAKIGQGGAGEDVRHARLVYADWLEEHDRPLDAARQRSLAGACELRWRLFNRKTGHFVDGPEYKRKGDLVRYVRSNTQRRRFDYVTYTWVPMPKPHLYHGHGVTCPEADLELVAVVLRAEVVHREPACKE